MLSPNHPTPSTVVALSTAEDDARLISRAQRGDGQALDALLRRHKAAIERLCRRLCKDEAQVDDVLQDTYVAILRSLPSFRGDAGFLTWVYTIARTHRGRARRSALRDRGRLDTLKRLAAVAYPDGPSLDDGIAGREIGAALEHALAPLSEADRAIIISRDVEGLAAAEIAERLGLTVPAVKTRLHRARVAVRGQLQRMRPAQSRCGLDAR